MRRLARRFTPALVAVLFSLSLTPALSHAESATPTPGPISMPHEFCTPEEIDAGLRGISELPLYDVLVSPASAPGTDLYVVKVILEPGACLPYTGHFLHDGAAIWLVDSGEIEFDFQLIPGRPVPDLDLQHGSGNREPVTAFMHLEAGDWVSADRAVHYSYRNAGQTQATVIMTVLEDRWIYTGAEFNPIVSSITDCRGVCRNARR